MSDMSTAEIAANVVETAEAAPIDTPSEPVAESIPQAETAAPQAQEPPPSKAELLLRKNGFKHKFKPDGVSEHWLKRSRVEKVIEDAFAQAESEWTPTKTQLEQQLADYKARVEAWTPIAEALDGGPEAFLPFVTQRDQRYSIWQKQPEPPPQTAFSLPEPDITLPDGSKTFSLKGIQAALEATAKLAVEQAKEAAAAQLKPLTEREERAKQESAASERRRAVISEAETWPWFKEHRADIEKAMAEDSEQFKTSGQYKFKNLDAAYRHVVFEKLAAADADRRAQWIKEQQQAPTSTSIPRNGGEVPKPSKPRTTEEIAREVVGKAG